MTVRNFRPFAVLPLAALLLAACATPYDVTKTSRHDNQPTKRFTHCNRFGCGSMYGMVFSDAEWAEMDRQIVARIEEACRFAEKSPFPAPEEALDDVFAA